MATTKLVSLLAAEIERDGGVAQVKRLPMYSPTIRKLLEDRRLLPFLRSLPAVFTLISDESAGCVCRVRMADSWSPAAPEEPAPPPAELSSPCDHVCRACAARFSSKSALFKHLRANCSATTAALPEHATAGPGDTPAAAARIIEAVTCALRHRRSRVSRRAEGGVARVLEGAPLGWLCSSRQAKVKNLLIAHMRMSVSDEGPREELLSEGWWQQAMRCALGLLQSRADLFTLSQPQPHVLAEVTVQLIDEPTALADQEAAELAIGQRVIELISSQRMVKSAHDPSRPPPGKGKHFLGKLATDPGLQRLLQGRELVQVLQRHSGLTGPIQLAKGGWYVKLAKGGGEPALEAAPRGDACREDSQKMCSEVPHVRIVFSALGLCVVQKLSGVSTEELVQKVAEQDDWCPEAGYSVNTVSRLDQPTSGVLVLPTSLSGERHLIEQFKHRRVSKTYQCLVLGETEMEGNVETKLKVIDNRSNFRVVVHHQGKAASTNFQRIRLLEREGVRYSLLDVQPVTGRTHQIRVHMMSVGHPLVGDCKYNNQNQVRKQGSWCKRLFLHASRLELLGMDGGVDVTVGLDDELQTILDSMTDVVINQ